MRKLTGHIVSVTLALVFLVSTSGIMVFIHHCHHLNKTYSSVFINLAEQSHSSCQEEEPSCCSEHSKQPNSVCGEPCCQNIEFLIKISPDTEPVKKTLNKVQPVLASQMPTEKDGIFKAIHHNKNVIYIPAPDRSPCAGKRMVIQNHQLKTGDCC